MKLIKDIQLKPKRRRDITASKTMRKSIFILAVLFATFANAQIEKEWSGTIGGYGTGIQTIEASDFQLIGSYFLSWREINASSVYYDIINAITLKTEKSLQLNETGDGFVNIFGDIANGEKVYFISKGIFSTDGKWACLVLVPTGEGTIQGGAAAGLTYHIYTEAQVRNEDGTVLATIPYYDDDSNYGSLQGEKIKLGKAGNVLKLFVPKNKRNENYGYVSFNGEWDIYSLPGEGSMQDFVSISSPNKMTTRKFIQNDQVLIESNDQTFNMQGQRIK